MSELFTLKVNLRLLDCIFMVKICIKACLPDLNAACFVDVKIEILYE